MGNGFLSRIQGKGKDHAEEDMGASIWSKGGFEMCALQVKNRMHSWIICIESFNCWGLL